MCSPEFIQEVIGFCTPLIYARRLQRDARERKKQKKTVNGVELLYPLSTLSGDAPSVQYNANYPPRLHSAYNAQRVQNQLLTRLNFGGGFRPNITLQSTLTLNQLTTNINKLSTTLLNSIMGLFLSLRQLSIWIFHMRRYEQRKPFPDGKWTSDHGQPKYDRTKQNTIKNCKNVHISRLLLK